MTGAEYIAAFLASKGVEKVFLLTGGAATFMVDAIGRHPQMGYVCFQHEQSAAMAADAIWRVQRKPGVALATSGPGATNLLTGIACSYFDSIPSIHITGQVNMRESVSYLGAQPRQVGFQETKIVEMARPITKYAKMVRTGDELKEALSEAWFQATTGRMGPVLIDVPMDVQQMEVGAFDPVACSARIAPAPPSADEVRGMIQKISAFFEGAERPLVYLGAGVGLAGAQDAVTRWIEKNNIPFVSSWNGSTYFNHDMSQYCGCVGVYGNRGANFLVQNCDRMLVLGSRLDNRQRSSDPKKFARGAKLMVVDVDAEELAKYKNDQYATLCAPLDAVAPALMDVAVPLGSNAWRAYIEDIKETFFDKCQSSFAIKNGTQSPHDAVRRVADLIDSDAIVVNDTGAALCWFFQAFHRTGQDVFTAGGHSPMGYSLPAAIGAKIVEPNRQVVCFAGDGGFQLNIQELSLLPFHQLDIIIVIMNNGGYGIIKQFQEAYLKGRYHASGDGYCQPDFAKVIEAYGLRYHRIEKPSDITPDMLRQKGSVVLDVILDPNTPIEPKVEMGRPINDQYPYLDDATFQKWNAFVSYERTGSAEA